MVDLNGAVAVALERERAAFPSFMGQNYLNLAVAADLTSPTFRRQDSPPPNGALSKVATFWVFITNDCYHISASSVVKIFNVVQLLK